MGDFNIQFKVRNGRLLRAMRKVSDSAADFARQSGVNQSRLGEFLAMKVSPMLKGGDWSKSALDICFFVGCVPEDIWPDHMARLLLKKSTAEVEMSQADVMAIAGPEQQVMQRSLIARFAETLSPREINILGRLQYGDSVADIASDEGCGLPRIYQIEKKCLRKMRVVAARNGCKSYADVASC